MVACKHPDCIARWSKHISSGQRFAFLCASGPTPLPLVHASPALRPFLRWTSSLQLGSGSPELGLIDGGRDG